MWRRAWALAFVLAAGCAVAAVLAGQSARVLIRSPLVERSARGPLVAVPLDEIELPAGRAARRIELSSDAAAELAAHDELWLFPSPPAEGARVVAAELRVTGTSCRFDAAAGLVLVEGGDRRAEPLVLRPAPECRGASLGLSRRLELTIELARPGAIGLWAHQPRPGSAGRGLVLLPGAAAARPLSVRGFRVDYPKTAPRVELLAAMWGLAASARWLWLGLGCGIALALMGCLVFPTAPAPSEPTGSRRGFALASGVGAALLAGGLAVLYAVVTPPLCGPDEPYHLMGYAELAGDQPLVEETLTWMRQTHQMRIRHRPEERFRTVDVGAPEEAEDPDARVTETEMRSASLAALWRAVSPLLKGGGARRTLPAIRLLNALVFSLAVGTATALAALCAAVPFPQWISTAFFFVPTLPFFAMHMSETALLCSLYALLATSLAVLFLDGPRAHWAGLPLGLASGLMLAGGRSPWPLAAIVGAALAARATLGASESANRRRAAAVFWLGAASCVAAYGMVQNEAYQQMVGMWTHFVPFARPSFVRPRSLAALVAVGLLMGAGLEWAPRRLRDRLGRRLACPAANATRWIALALAAFVLVSLAASLVLRFPQLELEPRHPLTLAERLRDVLATTATSFRLREPNFLLATSFWVGFGWLDAIPGPAFQGALVLLLALATVALLVSLARPPQPRRFAWLGFLGLGGAASLVLYTIVTQDLPLALHGRYLIGWHLVFLTLAACGLAGVGAESEAWRRRRSAWLPAILLVTTGGIHAYCLCFILRRYF